LILTAVLIVILLLTLPTGMDAQDDNQAALVIDYGEGNVETRCVAFSTPQISGYDLLERSGLVLEIDVQAGGAAVCRIEAMGCPAADCFCQCRGGDDCRYWSYWNQMDGQWVYSQMASTAYQVSDGAVEGWVWGPGSVTEAPPPPSLSFAEICQAGPVSETPIGSNGKGGWLPYALFALVVLGLAALLFFARRRPRGLSE
jgi:hypothetical protein